MLKPCFIDFEYQSETPENHMIHTVICCAVKDEKIDRVFWLHGANNELLEFIEYMDSIKSSHVLVCHYAQLAEQREFCKLGLRPCEWFWYDTQLIAHLRENTSATKTAGLVEQRYSLVYCCSKIGIQLDVDEKDSMRDICIHGSYDDIEKNMIGISTYCHHDIENLEKLFSAYTKDKPQKTIQNHINLSTSTAYLAQVADRGIPINTSSLTRALERVEQLQKDEMYANREFYKIEPAKPAIYYKDTKANIKKGIAGKLRIEAKPEKWTFNTIDTLKRVKALTGDNDANLEIKYLDRNQECDEYIKKLLKHKRTLTGLNCFSKNYNKFIGHNTIDYQCLHAFGTKTSRCTASPAHGFLWLLSREFYGLVEPPKGKCIFELDYSSQETLIQAAIYNDNNMLEIYNSKDPYLWLMHEMKMIPTNEYNSLTKTELKAKYGEQRQQIKRVFLGWSYGAGANTIAKNAKIDFDTAQTLRDKLNNIFIKTVNGRKKIIDNIDKKKFEVLPDGWAIARDSDESATTVGNFPVQGRGACILREVVKQLETNDITKNTCISTIHDAVVLMCDIAEYTKIKETAINIMIKSSENILGPLGKKIKVSESFFLTNGDFLSCEGKERFESCFNDRKKIVFE